MSLPKEPRQKMINMMYLVLTALLALNVSSEILNAFITVNKSIGKSNDVIDQKNLVTYENFKRELNDNQTKEKAAIWAPKAEQAQKLSASLASYIDALKVKLKVESGLRKNSKGEEEFKEDNLDASTRLFDKNGEGKKLYDALAKYRQDVLDILKPEEFNDPIQSKTVQTAKENFAKTLPVDMTVPASKTGEKRSQDYKGWTQNYFHMTPTVAALTILSKFQNDVKASEAQIVDFLHDQVGQVKVIFDQFQAIAQANTSYAMPGDEVLVTAGVGAFSAAAKPRITINGQTMPLTAEGTALYKTTASGVGDRTIDVKIEYTKPDGSLAVVNKPVKFTVGVPSGASVFLEKMNVMYIGVDNPLTISGGSVGSEKVHVTFPSGSLTKVSGDHYIAKPTTPGMSKIVVNADGKNFEFPMRIKYLPNPAGFIGSRKGGTISTAEFKAIGALIARLEDSDFEAPFKVISYKLAAIGGGIPVYTEANNDGNRWSGSAAAIVGRATPGSNIFFDEIKVVGPDGRARVIQPMVFNLK